MVTTDATSGATFVETYIVRILDTSAAPGHVIGAEGITFDFFPGKRQCADKSIQVSRYWQIYTFVHGISD